MNRVASQQTADSTVSPGDIQGVDPARSSLPIMSCCSALLRQTHWQTAAKLCCAWLRRSLPDAQAGHAVLKDQARRKTVSLLRRHSAGQLWDLLSQVKALKASNLQATISLSAQRS